MADNVKITRELSGRAAIGKRDRQDALRYWMEALGRAIHRIRKPNKFTRAAAAFYGHVERGRRYIMAKVGKAPFKQPDGTFVRATGEGLDFVCTGASRDSIMQSMKIDATARSSTEAQVRVPHPAPAFNFAKLSDGMSVADEFTLRNDEEDRRLYAASKPAHDRHLRRIASSRTRTKQAA